jgi:hypothetical protein
MKANLVVIFCLLSTLAAAQGRGGGGRPSGFPGAASPGAGGPLGAGRPSDVGRPSNSGQPSDANSAATRTERSQQPLRDAQINGGAFRMLEQKTGMTQDQLKALYGSSGAKNFGEFTAAVVVSKNLGLDTNKVLDGLKTKSLGQTVQDLGVASGTAKSEIKKAKNEVKTSS